MAGSMDIILPGLFDLPAGELKPGFLKNELPHLNQLLCKAGARPNNLYSIDAMIRAALHFEPGDGLPLAQAFVEPADPRSDHCVLFQAVHLQADLHNALIHPIGSDEKNNADISLIISDLSDLFSVDFDITAITDNLFLMKLNDFPAPAIYPQLLSVLGKTANPYYQQTREHLPWYRLLNEIQMFMHQHEVNQQRLQNGVTTINSLWLWGAGQLPAAAVARPDWYCDDIILTRFAESMGLRVLRLEQLDQCEPGTDSVVVDLRLAEALKSDQDTALDQLLITLDRGLLKAALASGCRLRLRSGFDSDLEWTATSKFKFWRKNKYQQWPG